MRKIKTIFALGLLILITPILGFPTSWESFFINTAGILICLISFVMYRGSMNRRKILEDESQKDGSQDKNEFARMV
jgi:amino acid permease